jgi:hypothetical protein
MRTLYLLIMINISFVLTSCASINAEKPVDNSSQATPTTIPGEKAQPQPYIPPPGCPPIKKDKNPLAVSFYKNDTQISHNYKVIGTGIVSKYNTVGIKRQEASIQDNMRKIAAAMGGDAIINVTRNNKVVSGTVVSFDEG